MSFSSSSTPQKDCDLFVSYRSSDEKKCLVSHLRHRLEVEGFTPFFDDNKDDAGKRIMDKILSAIHQATVALIVLSTNYAGSKWCLDELVEILKCNSERENLVVIPIFYDVVPDHVEDLRIESEFGLAFQRLCKKEGNGQRRTTWEKALQEVTNFSGFELKNYRSEADLLNTVIDSLYGKIYEASSLKLSKYAIGADRLAKDVIPLLKIGQKDVRMIGISGIEGIGKTFVARAVCKGALGKFGRVIFLDKVGEVTDNDRAELQKKLLQNLTNMNRQMLYDSSYGLAQRIKDHLPHKNILLVLDGVIETKHIEPFGAENRESFHSGSRILITTRDRNLLRDLKVDDTYNVEGLNRDEAFRLFCLHAFKGEEPKEGYEVLSRYLAHYAGGHPSALQKWGSTLNQLPKPEWQKYSDDLVKNPELINSLIKYSWFLQYPRVVVGSPGGDRTPQTWKTQGCRGVRNIEKCVDSEGIKFITVHYGDGRSPPSVTLGTKGRRPPSISLDNRQGGYLTYMSGHAKEDPRRTILQSLTFYTNRGKCKWIGTNEEGSKFSFPYTGRKIVGFRWSCNGSHLESIEAIYGPAPHIPIGYSDGVFGPFGGAGEKLWDSGDINGILVSYADFIKDIKFKVDDDTSSRPTYGGTGGANTFKVKLENPYEWITSFVGYFKNGDDGRIQIKSLTFQTNKRILGPIGREEGKPFSSPLKAVKVTRFFGRTIDFLESIGAKVKPYYPFESVGLFGCPNVSNSDYWHDRDDDYTNVREIAVEFALDDVKSVGSVQKTKEKTFVRSITFHYEVKKKRLPQKKRHPGTPAEGIEPLSINIRADEYLTSMSGYYTDNGITSLTFATNQRTLEFVAREDGIHFSSPVTGGKIVGFYGRSGKNLEAIGAYFEKIPHLYPIKSIGPFGGSSGDPWDHRNVKGVSKIEVKYHIHIHSIEFVYMEGSHASILDGTGGCARGDTVTLDYPREYLTSISGYTQNDAIQSLTFHSNKGIYGPYGKEDGKYFWYPSNGSKITSFYGTQDSSSGTLKSIGVYVEPIPRRYPFKTIGPFGGSDGIPWDDGVHTDVRGFRIIYKEAIQTIRIAYDNNGSFVSGSNHGTRRVNDSFTLKPGNRHGDEYEEVILDYPKERLRLIWVWEDQDGNRGQIHDLQIITTRKTYGPFIKEKLPKRDKLTKRRIPSKEDGGRIVGFFGTARGNLNSIGARLEPY